MEVDITGTNIELPNNLHEGQTLPDAHMDMNISMGPITMKMSVRMVNRKVEGKETVTTPAGTFECMIIAYDAEMKMSGVNKIGHLKQWMAEGVGMVKSEEIKNGKIMGSSLLTEFSK